MTLVTMESSGHYWMPLACHLRRRDVPVAVVNPLAAKYFARSRLARTKSDPADARSLAEMAMRDTPPARDPLAGAELRQAARFAMTLVDGAGEGLPAPDPPRRARLPGARRAVRRSDLPDGAGGAPDRPDGPGRHPAADIDPGQRQRRSGSSPPRPGEGRAAPGRRGRLDRRARARRRGRLRGRPPARPVRPPRAPDHRRRPPGRGPPRRRDRPPAPDHPGGRALDRGDPARRDRRHRALHRLRPAPRVRRRPPRRAQLRHEGIEPRDLLAHEQGRQQPPPGGGLPHGRRRRPAQPGHRRPLRPQAGSRQVEDERPRPLHAQGAQHRLGRLAQRRRLRPQLGVEP